MANPYDSPIAAIEEPLRDPQRCPTCGGRDFCEGRVQASSLSNYFIPDSWHWFRWRQGLEMKSIACLECGQVRQFISKDDLGELRRS